MKLSSSSVKHAVIQYRATQHKHCTWVCTASMVHTTTVHHTLRLGVKGSGSLMLRGKALRMRFLIWMQLGGITSQKE